MIVGCEPLLDDDAARLLVLELGSELLKAELCDTELCNTELWDTELWDAELLSDTDWLALALLVVGISDATVVWLETAADDEIGEVNAASLLLLEDGGAEMELGELHGTVVHTSTGLNAEVTYDVTAMPPLSVNVVVETVCEG
jgi:hypothetical protein